MRRTEKSRFQGQSILHISLIEKLHVRIDFHFHYVDDLEKIEKDIASKVKEAI